MYQVKGKNKMGDIETIILDGKNMYNAMLYAKRYFIEMISIRIININENDQFGEKELQKS